MSAVAVKVQGLSKQYRIGTNAAQYGRLTEALWSSLTAPARRLRGGAAAPRKRADDRIWALRDVSLEVREGQVAGIVGRNGAGKTTLLKVLCRITAPTEGRVELRGRAGALLEVGTGFHPELTGRENVYLNGAILGMRRSELVRRFDEIVAFSGVERFIDTPVKRYSSGMYVRLAFAVAAHLEPEILIVDEVLAVGDAEFQRRCLGKMDDVARQGRTVLLVSHNMASITRLCSEVIWLDGGRVRDIGPPDAIVAEYLRSASGAVSERRWEDRAGAPGSDEVWVRSVRVLDAGGSAGQHFEAAFPLVVEIEHEVVEATAPFRICVRLYSADGAIVFQSCDNAAPDWADRRREPGTYVSRCVVPGHLLNHGHYTIAFSADIPFQKLLFFEEAAIAIEVLQGEQTGGRLAHAAEEWPGVINPDLDWQIESLLVPEEARRS